MKTRLSSRSEHQVRVEEFMEKASQACPLEPTIPDPATRILRVKLILEEALETFEGFGVDIHLPSGEKLNKCLMKQMMFSDNGNPDLVEVADGCADISVVTTGSLSACGISDMPLLEEVDNHNLAKFGPGGYRREDGKWVKPADLQPPDIQAVLNAQKMTSLFVWFNGTDYVIATTPEKADEILSEAADTFMVSEWTVVNEEATITTTDIESEQEVTLTAREWIEALGEGFLHSED